MARATGGDERTAPAPGLRARLAAALPRSQRRPGRRGPVDRRPSHPRSVAVVQSDIVASTELLRAARERYPDLLLRHRALIAGAVRRLGGRFLSHAGDGTLAVFDHADDAIAASVAAQQALAAERWPQGLAPRVRMGVHAGEVYEVAGEPVGLTIHQGARIMALARGGQVMVSGAAAAEAAASPGDRYAVADAGWHAVRDHTGPVRLHQVVADGLTVVPAEGAGVAIAAGSEAGTAGRDTVIDLTDRRGGDPGDDAACTGDDRVLQAVG
jgi:class 3 adenylate cyclase